MDYDDDNWLRAEVELTVGAFGGSFTFMPRTAELSAFLEQLIELNQSLRGVAEFVTLEEQVALRLEGNGRGHIQLTGFTQDKVGVGNKLSFSLELDQTHLQSAIRELKNVVETFPVRAS